MEEQETIRARIPRDLKDAFDDACKRNDQTASQVLRAFIREYTQKNAQGELLKGKR